MSPTERATNVPLTAALPLLLTAALIRKLVLPVGRRTMQRYLASGEFPPPDLRLNGKGYWRRETVLAWLAERAPVGASVEVVTQ